MRTCAEAGCERAAKAKGAGRFARFCSKHLGGARRQYPGAYNSWASMTQRCTNELHPDYADYGGRGIDICQRWRGSFATFLAYMGDRPAGTTIDRIDNSKGYEPSNCRWATATEQSRNRRGRRELTHDGRVMLITDWAREVGMSIDTIRDRLDSGWSVARALTVLPATKARYQHRHVLDFQGESLPIFEWARRTGISATAIESRVGKFGWTVERALTSPVRRMPHSRSKFLKPDKAA